MLPSIIDLDINGSNDKNVKMTGVKNQAFQSQVSLGDKSIKYHESDF